MTLYGVLGLPPSSSTAMLRDRYLSLARQHHPDVGGDIGKFQELTVAWAVLKDEAKRKRYDAQLRLEGGQCTECQGKGTLQRTLKFTRREIRICPRCGGSGRK